MFKSLKSPTVASAGTPSPVHPPHSRLPEQGGTFGPLTNHDLEWLCPSGIATETQTWYTTTADGKLIMCQIIHSAVGMWYPTISFTFRYYDPAGPASANVFKQVSVTNFVTAPKPFDKRSCKSDQFTITVDPANPDTYQISGTYDKDTQVNLSFKRYEHVPGFKLGSGPKGGFTYFGSLKDTPSTGVSPDVAAGADGYVVHRFWPRCKVGGIVRHGSQVLDLEGSNGIFIHAIQGMRPDSIASRWNFANFQSPSSSADQDSSDGSGVSLTMMEFTTTSAYGSRKVNVGSIVVDDRLVAVTANSTATHSETTKDSETSYDAPGAIDFEWKGEYLLPATAPTSSPKSAEASIKLELGKPGEPYAANGLIEKVDVLAQVPYLVKKVISYATGTQPYIYTYQNKVKARISVPNNSGEGERVIEAEGWLFNEATFISL